MPSPAATETARPTGRRPARLDPDTLPALVTAVLLTAMLCAVSFVLSYSGLVAVADWAAVPPYLSWTVPVTIDASILVYTLAVFIFRARGERNGRVWTSLILFTAVSVAANAAHAWDAGAGDWHGYAGAAIAGLAPVSVLLTTHTLAELVVAKPTSHAIARVSTSPPASEVGITSDRPVPTTRDRTPQRSSNPQVPKRPAVSASDGIETGGAQETPLGAKRPLAHAESLHLVDQPSAGRRGSIPMGDEDAVEVIRGLDARSGPVSRRVVEKAVGCGASRATRLMDLARSSQQTDRQTA